MKCIDHDISHVMRNLSFKFSTISDLIRDVQPQNMVRGLKYQIEEDEQFNHLYVAKTNILMRCAVIAKLICAFVFASP